MHCFARHEKRIARYEPAYFWRAYLIAGSIRRGGRYLPHGKPFELGLGVLSA
jgi:hypothetical protein